MAKLSAAMIVRDEGHHLEACLRSIEGLVDEVVVVDTGSIDETCSIAPRFGARVYERPWDDDFAAARNSALERATGDWILYIDADERVRPIARCHLEPSLANEDLIGLRVVFHPSANVTAYRELRLFRNRPLIRFEGVMHENIWPGVVRHMRAHGGRIGECDVTFDHEGYEGDQTAKHHRNLPLLMRALADDPEHVYCWYHLGLVQQGLGHPAEARAAWLAGIDVVRKKGPISTGALSYLHLLEMEIAAGNDCRDLLDEALELFPDVPHLVWLDGRLSMRDGCHHDAIRPLERLLGWPDEPVSRLAYDRRGLMLNVHRALAACHFVLGNHEIAARHFAEAERSEPDHLEHRVKRQLCERLAETRSPSLP